MCTYRNRRMQNNLRYEHLISHTNRKVVYGAYLPMEDVVLFLRGRGFFIHFLYKVLGQRTVQLEP